MRKNFLKKSYIKCGRETLPRPFYIKSNCAYLLNWESKVLSSLLLLYVKLRTIEIYWNQAVDHLLLPHIKLFKKSKRGMGLASLLFEEKYLSFYILLPDQVSLSCCFYFLRYCGICVLQMLVNQVGTSQIVKLTLSFWSK